ncbi:MAG TPA: efflux RND transporter periplasmic adaptor subunit [Steroidobacteraceae bacterium]|nr:efflux RND transporter periplasmic adaptor subunit [Steroidobacteraceae bacterium]
MSEKPKRVMALAGVAGLAASALIVSLWPPAPGATGRAEPVPAPRAAAATIELSPAQLGAIGMAAAETRSFPLEKAAVGSISFEEDPAIVQAESTLVAAASTLDLTAKEVARLRNLGTENGIAQKELEQAVSAEETAQAALKAARDALRALGKSDAEIDRMVAARRVENGPAGHPGRRWVLANVAESDSVLVHAGQPLSVRVMAYPGRTFRGVVSKVYAAVDPATHRLAVRAEIADPANELRAGMLADVSIRVREPIVSPAVPENAAVREADGTSSLWVTTDRRHFSQRTVRIGERSGGWVQILEGLEPGELVVADGAVFLSNMLQATPGD